MYKSAFSKNNKKKKSESYNILYQGEVLSDYCRRVMSELQVEELRMFMIDESLLCFNDKIISRGTVDQTIFNSSEIVLNAVKTKSFGVILAHNHSQENCLPSEQDIRLTLNVAEALKNENIRLIDHLIISKDEIFSFKSAGFLS